MSKLTLTNSSISTHMGCPHRYWWAYEQGIRPTTDALPLTLGKVFHAALECLNQGGAEDDATAICYQSGLEPAEQERVACMVAGWAWRWAAAPAFKRILASERAFEFRVVKRARWMFAGKIDVIGELENGEVAVGEYKTTTEDIAPDSDYWRRLLIDRQISGYMLGARELGFPATTVLYDVARKPAHDLLRATPEEKRKYKKDGTLYANQREVDEPLEDYRGRLMDTIVEKPDYYYQRQEIPRLDADLELWREEVAHLSRTMRGKFWPRNTDHCKRWGTCPYFNPCTSMYDLATQGTPNGFERVDNIHRELLSEEHHNDNTQNTTTTSPAQ